MTAPISDSRPPTRYAWAVVFMLWWISFFNYADRQAINSVFPKLHEEMGLTDTQKGQLGSAFALVYGIGALFAGVVVDRVVRKTAILGGLHAWSVICMATALATNFRQLYWFRAAEGLGETFYYPASTSLISDYHGKATRSRALGLHQTSVYIGTIAGGWAAGAIGLHYGWRWSFICFGGLGVVLGVILQFTLREPARGAAEDEPRQAEHMPLGQVFRLLWKTPAVLFLLLAFACANYVAMVLLTWMPDYLNRQFGLRLDWAGLGATAPPQLASMLGALLGGWLADYWRARRVGGRMYVQAIGVLAGAPFVFLCGQIGTIGWFLAALAGWGLFKGIYDANIFASVFDLVPPAARGTVAGLMNTFGWLVGGATGPWVVGMLSQSYGLGPAIGTAAIVYLAAGFMLLAASAAATKKARQQS
jgi:MFS family permease